MKTMRLLRTIISASILFSCSQAYAAAAGTDTRGRAVEENIWALEEAYFANLYKANYAGVLSLTHSQFLGWPGRAPQPLDHEGSARFMKQLIPEPATCAFMIERAGIRVRDGVALTQYIIHVKCKDTTGVTKTESSRITHTWVKECESWKLLGGMSCDK
jgi:hypothetical protein